MVAAPRQIPPAVRATQARASDPAASAFVSANAVLFEEKFVPRFQIVNAGKAVWLVRNTSVFPVLGSLNRTRRRCSG